MGRWDPGRVEVLMAEVMLVCFLSVSSGSADFSGVAHTVCKSHVTSEDRLVKVDLDYTHLWSYEGWSCLTPTAGFYFLKSKNRLLLSALFVRQMLGLL